MLQRDNPPNSHFFELFDDPVVPDSASDADSNNPDEANPEHQCQRKQICEHQSGHQHSTNKFTFTYGPKTNPILHFHTLS